MRTISVSFFFPIFGLLVVVNWSSFLYVHGGSSKSGQTGDPKGPESRSYDEESRFCDQIQLLHCQRLEGLVDIIPQAQWPEYLVPEIKKCDTNGIFKVCGETPKLRHPAIAMTTTMTSRPVEAE